MNKFEQTPEETAATSFLDWDTERIGALVKHTAQHLYQSDVKGFKGITTMAACYVLANACGGANAGRIEVTLDNFRLGDSPGASYRIVVEEIEQSGK